MIKSLYLCCKLVIVFSILSVTLSTLAENLELHIHSNAIDDKNNYQTIDVLDENSPQQLSSTRLEDNVDYIPSVFMGRAPTGSSTDISIRGFSIGGRTYLDGVLDNQNLFIRDPSTVERVEIIKGQNSVLYGSGSPGGTVNYISKKPQSTPINTLKVSAGSPDFYRIEHDKGGKITPEGNFQYRMVTALQKAKTGMTNVQDDRITLMPSLRWQNNKTKLDISAEYSKRQRPFDFDNVIQNGEPVFDVSYVDPRRISKRHHRLLNFGLEHYFNPSLKANFRANRVNVDRTELLSGYWYKTSENDLRGYYREVEDDYNQISLKGELVGSLARNHFSNEITVGLEKNRQDSRVESGRNTTAFTLDINNPVFDFTLPAADQLTENNYQTLLKDKAIYLTNKTVFGEKWLLNTGLRKSWFSESINKIDFDYPQSDSDAVSSTIGLSYRPNENILWHANRSTSFSPNSPDNSQNLFPPKKAVQFEAGIRIIPKNSDWDLNLVAYNITQSKLAIVDPDDRDIKILAGEQRVKGIEVSVKKSISQNLQLRIAYSNMSGKITKDSNGLEGNRINNVPKHSGSVNLNYRVGSGETKKTKLSLGIVAAGKRQGDRANSFEVDGYARVDFSANHAIGKNSTLNLSIKNLLGKDYVAASYAEDILTIGYSRRAVLSFEHTF